MRSVIVLCLSILVGVGSLFSQPENIVVDDGVTGPLHAANVGKITFMAKPIPIEEYRERDFLKSFELKDGSDLNIRTFLGSSLTNYLHRLAPEMSVDELNRSGNYQFCFFVDGVLVYKENLHPGAGGLESKRVRTVFRVPLISSTEEDSWGRFLWARFMESGGESALNAGKHLLRIEIRPYLAIGDVKLGELVAQGQLEIVVTKPKIAESKIRIQPIRAKSGWKISRDIIDKTKIRELNQKIAENGFKSITSIVVVKNGELLIEEYFNGANRRTLHDTRSVGKTFASAITGIAIRDGYLTSVDQTLDGFYDLKTYKNYSPSKGTATLKDLLTMSSVFDGSDMDQESPGNEGKMYPTDNWVKFVLDLPVAAERSNGKQWNYFTGGVVVLGDILNSSVPNGLEKYANEKLFQPLGIKDYKWQYTPQGVANTAGGLQLNALDYAKFGQLYQYGGTWNGRQILLRSWVESSLSRHLEIPERPNEFYGYLFWNKTFVVDGKPYEAFYCSGNGGNSIYVFKNIPLVIVITATAYNKPYAHPQIAKIIQNYILPATLPK